MPIFDALRPEGPREEGFVHAGSVGAGHYAKMVHNGIEYGLMQAYAEGYELLAAKDIVTDVHGCFQAWTRGTVVRSWLLDLLVKALAEDPGLDEITGYVEDSGEGRWTVEEGIDNSVPMPVDHGRAVRPVRLAAGRQPGDEGGRGAAQPVRWPRGQGGRGTRPGRRRAPARPRNDPPMPGCRRVTG